MRRRTLVWAICFFLSAFLGACNDDDDSNDADDDSDGDDDDSEGDDDSGDDDAADDDDDDSGDDDDTGDDDSELWTFPGAAWDELTPAEVGLDASAIDDFADHIGGVGCVVRYGYLVHTWGDPDDKADWASAAKPVISTLLFFAVHEGLIDSVDALVGDQGWNLTAEDQTMTFAHLANMTSGYARDEEPGDAWAYNDVAISLYAHTLFDLVFDVDTPDDAARAAYRLGALEFQDGSIFSTRDGYGLCTSPRDFARIGWLWLNHGSWGNVQLLPQHFFDDNMSPHVPGDMTQSSGEDADYLGVGSFGGGTYQTEYGPGIYGFNWWFNTEVGTTGERTWPDAPTDTFQANGHWDTEIMTVIPSLGLVVAARGDWGAFEPGSEDGMNATLRMLAEAVTN